MKSLVETTPPNINEGDNNNIYKSVAPEETFIYHQENICTIVLGSFYTYTDPSVRFRLSIVRWRPVKIKPIRTVGIFNAIRFQ